MYLLEKQTVRRASCWLMLVAQNDLMKQKKKKHIARHHCAPTKNRASDTATTRPQASWVGATRLHTRLSNAPRAHRKRDVTKRVFRLTCRDSSGRAALHSNSEQSSSVYRRRRGAHGGRSAVFEHDIFFRFDSVGARTRKSSGPKELTWRSSSCFDFFFSDRRPTQR